MDEVADTAESARRLRGRGRARMDALGCAVVADEVAAGRGGSGRPRHLGRGRGSWPARARVASVDEAPHGMATSRRVGGGRGRGEEGGKRVAASPRARPRETAVVKFPRTAAGDVDGGREERGGAGVCSGDLSPPSQTRPCIARWKVVDNVPTDEVPVRGRRRSRDCCRKREHETQPQRPRARRPPPDGFRKRLALATAGKARYWTR